MLGRCSSATVERTAKGHRATTAVSRTALGRSNVESGIRTSRGREQYLVRDGHLHGATTLGFSVRAPLSRRRVSPRERSPQPTVSDVASRLPERPSVTRSFRTVCVVDSAPTVRPEGQASLSRLSAHRNVRSSLCVALAHAPGRAFAGRCSVKLLRPAARVQRRRGGAAQRPLAPIAGQKRLLAPDRADADACVGAALGTGALTRHPSKPAIAGVWARDGFSCCYRGRGTIPANVLRLVSGRLEASFRCQKGLALGLQPRARHRPLDPALPRRAGLARWQPVGGLKPLTESWRCEEQKSNPPVGSTLKRPNGGRDGLSRAYPDLRRFCGYPHTRASTSAGSAPGPTPNGVRA
jgi:hypothetical protein